LKSDAQTRGQSPPQLLPFPAPVVALHAPPSWRRIAFISDLHLGPEAPATTAGFLH
jgi:hypothetical protein